MNVGHWRPPTSDTASPGRSVLDRAEGVLITLRRCDAQAAFTELVRASHRHGVPVFTLAAALLELISCNASPYPAVPDDARRAARQEWAPLLR